MMWLATKSMLSAKFAQGEIILVDNFNLSSHKTKHVVQCFRRLVGDKCNSALCCHEGTRDVNDAFRWATAHIAAVRRCNVEGIDVYKLLKYRYLIITELGLQNLIYKLQSYPKLRKWGPKYATPDGRVVPVKHRPKMVPGWNLAWKERKERLRNSEFRAKLYAVERKKWKWSNRLEGALKLRAEDPLYRFRLKNFGALDQTKPWEKMEDIYLDDELTLEDAYQAGEEEMERQETEQDPEYLVDGSSLQESIERSRLMIGTKEGVKGLSPMGNRYVDVGMSTRSAGFGSTFAENGRGGVQADAQKDFTELQQDDTMKSVWRSGARYDAFVKQDGKAEATSAKRLPTKEMKNKKEGTSSKSDEDDEDFDCEDDGEDDEFDEDDEDADEDLND